MRDAAAGAFVMLRAGSGRAQGYYSEVIYSCSIFVTRIVLRLYRNDFVIRFAAMSPPTSSLLGFLFAFFSGYAFHAARVLQRKQRQTNRASSQRAIQFPTAGVTPIDKRAVVDMAELGYDFSTEKPPVRNGHVVRIVVLK